MSAETRTKSVELWCPDCWSFDGTHEPHCGDSKVQNFLLADLDDWCMTSCCSMTGTCDPNCAMARAQSTLDGETMHQDQAVPTNGERPKESIDSNRANTFGLATPPAEHLSTGTPPLPPPYTSTFSNPSAARQFLQTGQHTPFHSPTDNPTLHHHASQILSACLSHTWPMDETSNLINELFHRRPLMVEANVLIATTAILLRLCNYSGEFDRGGDAGEDDDGSIYWAIQALYFDKRVALNVVLGEKDLGRWVAVAEELRRRG